MATSPACWKCDHLRAAIRERDERIAAYPGGMAFLLLDSATPEDIEKALKQVHDELHRNLGAPE